MKVKIEQDQQDYGYARFKFTELAEEQVQKVLDLIEAQLQKIYVPLPVCGGDMEAGVWGWVMFDGFSLSVSYEDSAPEVVISVPMTPEGEDALDGMHPHYSKPRPTIWLDALPAAKMVFN